MGIQIQRVKNVEQCRVAGRLAEAIWGGDAACSSAQMVVHAKYGGVALLAYDDNEPVGFLFSFPAVYSGELVLWSHETGLLPSYLHQGIGAQLKRTQQRLAKEEGYRHIAWTFDPLVARNGYFNLNKLGARIAEYQRNVYGEDETDLVNRGMETDRFIALWDTEGTPSSFNAVTAKDAQAQFSHGETIRTEIPMSFSDLIVSDRDAALVWRRSFRERAEALMSQSYRPVSVQRDSERAYYVWKEETQS